MQSNQHYSAGRAAPSDKGRGSSRPGHCSDVLLRIRRFTKVEIIMATRAVSSSAEAEALKHAFGYLVNSMNTSSLLPDAFSKGLICEPQRTECARETNPYQKAEKFLEHLQREVNGDSKKFHTFVQLLEKTRYSTLVNRLHDELLNATRLMLASKTEGVGEPQNEKIVVPDVLLKKLVALRVSYARFLRRYKREIQNSPEAQEEFVETLPRLLHRGLGSERNFYLCFDILVEEEVSLFNTTHLKQICDIFPKDICATTKELVVRYEKQRQHFMTSTTVKQFKKLFPASATSSKLSTGKISLQLKLRNKWGDCTLSDLTDLVNLFGVPGDYLHLSKADKGCIAVLWLTSIINAKELKAAISDAADSLQSKGVLQIFVEKMLVLDCSQHDQAKKMEQKLLRPECGSKKNLANEIVTQGLVENDRPFTKGLAFMQLDSCDTNKWIVKKMKEGASLERQSPGPLKGMTKPNIASAGKRDVGCQVSMELVEPSLTMPWATPVEQQRPSQKPQTRIVYRRKEESSNTVSVIVLRKRDTPLVLQLIYHRKYMGGMGKQQVYRKLIRKHNGNKMIVYDVVIEEDLQISSSEYNRELRKISAECPTPHLVIFSFPLIVPISSQREECQTFFNVNNAFKKYGWNIWKYSMFILTHSSFSIKNYELELKKRRNSIKWGLERRHIRLDELAVMYMCQSITDMTSHKGISLLASFWEMVFATCDTTATEILEEFTLS